MCLVCEYLSNCYILRTHNSDRVVSSFLVIAGTVLHVFAKIRPQPAVPSTPQDDELKERLLQTDPEKGLPRSALPPIKEELPGN